MLEDLTPTELAQLYALKDHAYRIIAVSKKEIFDTLAAIVGKDEAVFMIEAARNYHA